GPLRCSAWRHRRSPDSRPAWSRPRARRGSSRQRRCARRDRRAFPSRLDARILSPVRAPAVGGWWEVAANSGRPTRGRPWRRRIERRRSARRRRVPPPASGSCPEAAMTPRISKTQRWLDLIAFLVGRRVPATVAEIMEGVPAYAEKWRTEDETARSSARRMFERDKDELRKQGIPLQTVKYTIEAEPVEGYRIQRRDFYQPYLRIVGGRPAGTSRRGRRPKADPASIEKLDLSDDEARLALDALSRVARLSSFPLAAEARSE